MEAFEIMEMNMEFLRKLPTPKELKEQFPVSEKIAAIKADRDRQIREIFEGKDSRLLLIIGPCSADNEDAVIDAAAAVDGVVPFGQVRKIHYAK